MLDYLEQYVLMNSDHERENLQVELNKWVTRLLTLLGTVRHNDELKQYISMDYPFLSLFFLANKLKPAEFTEWVTHQQSQDDLVTSTLESKLVHKTTMITQLKRDLMHERDKYNDCTMHMDELQQKYQHSHIRLEMTQNSLKQEQFKFHQCMETKSILEKFFFVALKGYQASGTPEMTENTYLNKLQQKIAIQEETLKECDKGKPSDDQETEVKTVIVDCSPIITPPEDDPSADMSSSEATTSQVDRIPMITASIADEIENAERNYTATSNYLSPGPSFFEHEKNDHSVDMDTDNVSDLLSSSIKSLQDALQEQTEKLSKTQDELNQYIENSYFWDNQCKKAELSIITKQSHIDQLIDEINSIKIEKECVFKSLNQCKQNLANLNEINKEQGLILEEEKKKNTILLDSLKEKCDKKLKNLLIQNKQEMDLMNAKIATLEAEIVENKNILKNQMVAYIEHTNNLKHELQKQNEKMISTEYEKDSILKQYHLLQEDTQDCRDIRDYMMTKFRVQLSHLPDYMSSLIKENKDTAEEITQLKSQIEMNQLDYAELDAKFKNNLILYDDIVHAKKETDKHINELNRVGDDKQRAYNELSHNYEILLQEKQRLENDLKPLVDDTMSEEACTSVLQNTTIKQLEKSVEAKNNVIANLRGNVRRQERIQLMKKQMTSNAASHKIQNKLQLALKKCQQDRENTEKELASLSNTYSDLADQGRHQLQRISELTAKIATLNAEKPSVPETTTYYKYFIKYIETVIRRFEKAQHELDYQTIYNELSLYYRKFITNTLSEKWHSFTQLIKDHETDDDFFEHLPPISKDGLETSEVVHLRATLSTERHDHHMSIQIVNTLKQLYPESTNLLESVVFLTQLFKSPQAFSKYISFYTAQIPHESHLNYIETMLSILKVFYDNNSSLHVLSTKLKRDIELLTTLGGIPFMNGLHLLLTKLDNTHDAIQYFATTIDFNNANNINKFYNGLEVFRNVFKASLHKTIASFKDMEKNYIVSLLQGNLDHTKYTYDIKNTDMEPSDKKRIQAVDDDEDDDSDGTINEADDVDDMSDTSTLPDYKDETSMPLKAVDNPQLKLRIRRRKKPYDITEKY